MSDKRLAQIGQDPRFRKAAISERKVVLDSRFSKVLKDKNFSTQTSTTRVRGLPSKETEENANKRFFASAEDEDQEFHWSAESSESEMSDIEEELADEIASNQSEKSYGSDSSPKLAVMNCNWEKITASDLFMMFTTFLKSLNKGQKVHSVNIYVSEFGASELEYEKAHGPRLELETKVSEAELSLMTMEKQQEHKRALNEAVRKYQKQKLKYYYAVAEFDSTETAEVVYNELDGITASFCAASLDVRFVPEDLEIPGEPVASCDKLPENFRPTAFDDGGAAVGMDNVNVKLTWDEDPPERKILRRKFNARQIMDLELSQYLASDSDEEVFDRDAYRRALLGEEGQSDVETGAGEEGWEETEVGDMEMHVNKDIEALGRKIASGDAKEKKDMSTWQTYLEKRKEQRKDKKQQRKLDRSEKVEERQHFLKGEELTPFVATKRKLPEQAVVSVTQDARLKKLFENPDFAIDTTVPHFDKKSKVLKEVLEEKAKRSKKHKH
jgi:hypothetical protein